MFSTFTHFLLASYIGVAIAEANGIANASPSMSATSMAAYPPSGLLDSIHSMKVREELYQRELEELAARQLVLDPEFSVSSVDPIPTGILESIHSIESLHRSLLIPEGDGSTAYSIGPTSTPSYSFPTIAMTSTIPPTIRPGLPSPLPEMTNYVALQTSNAPQPHILISIVWVLVISFIIGMTLYTALNGLGIFIVLFLVLNIICAVVVGAHAQPHFPPHQREHQLESSMEPRRIPIGGLRPGPIGKIPCGPLRGRIGTKHGHGFVHGLDRKVGGLRPVVEELMCDDWSNAKSLFGRGVSIPTMTVDSADDEEAGGTTTIYATKKTTVRVTVEDTATETSEMTTTNASITPFDTYLPALSTVMQPTPSAFSLDDLAKIEQESSAVRPAVNIRTFTSYLFLPYLLGVFLCLLAGVTPGALSYVVISLTIIAIIGGAEAVAVGGRPSLAYSVGWRIAGLRPAGAAKVRDMQEATVWNGTHTVTGSVEGARLWEICGEVYCQHWPSTEHETPILAASKPTPSYAELAKRLSTEFVTVTPTSGIIGIFGPQIIPVTVESTAYEKVVVSTVDLERVRSTRTKFVTIETSKPTPPGLLTVSKSDGMGGFGMTTLTAMPSDEVRTTISSSPASEASAKGVEVSTVFAKTTESALPASTVFTTITLTASPPVASSYLPDGTSSSPSNELPVETLSPMSLPATSSASHLDPSQLYLSFVETNLSCFLFLFVGLQLALTMSHPLVFLDSMASPMVGGAAAMQM